MPTFRGEPIHTEEGWVVLKYYPHGRQGWYPLRFTFAARRVDAIEKYDAMWVQAGEYRRARRRGQVKAVRCALEPLTFGE